MSHKEQARASSLRSYISIADFYERYWTVNGKPPPPLRKHERELLDALEAATTAPKPQHPLIYNVTDVPTRLQRWMLNNPSDTDSKPQ